MPPCEKMMIRGPEDLPDSSDDDSGDNESVMSVDSFRDFVRDEIESEREFNAGSRSVHSDDSDNEDVYQTVRGAAFNRGSVVFSEEEEDPFEHDRVHIYMIKWKLTNFEDSVGMGKFDSDEED